jgi:Ca2+-binding EF-hand superfamily protein
MELSNTPSAIDLLKPDLPEFRTFVEQTEKELRTLFQSIDHDGDGKLDKGELRNGFKRAGLTVPNSKLDQFFSEVDENHDVRCLYLWCI